MESQGISGGILHEEISALSQYDPSDILKDCSDILYFFVVVQPVNGWLGPLLQLKQHKGMVPMPSAFLWRSGKGSRDLRAIRVRLVINSLVLIQALKKVEIGSFAHLFLLRSRSTDG